MKKFLFLLLCFVLKFQICFAKQEVVKLYAFYTPSHQVFLDNWFIPSLQGGEYELIIECHKQEGSSKFMNKGWNKIMLRKIDLIIRAIKENWGDIFVHSDVDIQFFKPTKKLILSLMAGKDLVIQKRSVHGGICAGFFACRGNEKTLRLWQEIKERVKSAINSKHINDQSELSKLIYKSNPYQINWSYLPETFFSGGMFTGKSWSPGQELQIPLGIVLHHGNWTVGIENKIAQLSYVKNIVSTGDEKDLQ